MAEQGVRNGGRRHPGDQHKKPKGLCPALEGPLGTNSTSHNSGQGSLQGLAHRDPFRTFLPLAGHSDPAPTQPLIGQVTHPSLRNSGPGLLEDRGPNTGK